MVSKDAEKEIIRILLNRLSIVKSDSITDKDIELQAKRILTVLYKGTDEDIEKIK